MAGKLYIFFLTSFSFFFIIIYFFIIILYFFIIIFFYLCLYLLVCFVFGQIAGLDGSSVPAGDGISDEHDPQAGSTLPSPTSRTPRAPSAPLVGSSPIIAAPALSVLNLHKIENGAGQILI